MIKHELGGGLVQNYCLTGSWSNAQCFLLQISNIKYEINSNTFYNHRKKLLVPKFHIILTSLVNITCNTTWINLSFHSPVQFQLQLQTSSLFFFFVLVLVLFYPFINRFKIPNWKKWNPTEKKMLSHVKKLPHERQGFIIKFCIYKSVICKPRTALLSSVPKRFKFQVLFRSNMNVGIFPSCHLPLDTICNLITLICINLHNP